jgi:hypothetical protein
MAKTKKSKKVVNKKAKVVNKVVNKKQKVVKPKEEKKVLIFVKEPVSFVINRVEIKSEKVKREVIVEANVLEVKESQAESFKALIVSSYGEDMIV